MVKMATLWQGRPLTPRAASAIQAPGWPGTDKKMEMMRSGLLVILSSPSGAGKSTLARRLMEWDPSLRFSVSATTRAPRPGEIEGEHYYFRSIAEFHAMVAAGEMLEHAEVFGNFYGTPRAPVEQAMQAGRDTLFDVDWQGGQQIRASSLGGHVVSIFVLPPSLAELERRLIARQQDAPEVIAARMRKSRDEISHWAEYDYVIVNDDLEASTQALKTILTAERLRRSRQVGLGPFVRELMQEESA